MDKELETITKILELLEGMEWMQKHRIIDYVKARSEFDPVVDGSAQPLLGLNPIGKKVK